MGVGKPEREREREPRERCTQCSHQDLTAEGHINVGFTNN